MGWNAQPTRQVILDEVRVPAAAMLGELGRGFSIAMSGLNGGRINIAACSLGGAQFALDRAQRYVTERFTFGEPLAEKQSVVFTLADMATELRAARAMVRDAARALDRDEPDVAMQCAMAKRFATDVGFRVANDALQLHGGYGYLHDYGIERSFETFGYIKSSKARTRSCGSSSDGHCSPVDGVRAPGQGHLRPRARAGAGENRWPR